MTSAAIGAGRFFIGRGPTIQAWPVTKPAGCPAAHQPTYLQSPLVDRHRRACSRAPGAVPRRPRPFTPPRATAWSLSAATGRQAWSGTLGATRRARPPIANGFVYVPTASGERDVFKSNGCGRAMPAPCGPRTPAARSASSLPSWRVGIYIASADGIIKAFPSAGCDRPTCTALWSAATGSTITGGPVPALGNLYVGTADGHPLSYGL